MKIIKIKIDKLVPNPWNPNEQGNRVFEKEKNSIKRFGFIDPITVRKKDDSFEILDGEHRVKACKELNFEEVPSIVIDDISESDARSITLILNGLQGKNKNEKLAKVFEFLNFENSLDLEVLPFEEFEVDDILAFTEEEEGGEGAGESSQKNENKGHCLKVYLETEEELNEITKEFKTRGIKFKLVNT